MAESEPDNESGPNGSEEKSLEPAILDYAQALPVRLRTIARFPSEFEAILASRLLEEHGLSPQSIDNHDPWGRQSGTLRVAEEDVGAAVEVLSKSPARKHLIVDPLMLPPAPVLPPLTCPGCGSTDLAPMNRLRLILLPLILLGWLPFVHPLGAILYICVLLIWPALCLIDRPWVCRKCGQRLPPGGVTAGDERDDDFRAPANERFAGAKTAVSVHAPELSAELMVMAGWNKRDGDQAETGELLCELDIDGTRTAVNSPANGTVWRIKRLGEHIRADDEIARIETATAKST
jgi:hypothetical protein